MERLWNAFFLAFPARLLLSGTVRATPQIKLHDILVTGEFHVTLEYKMQKTQAKIAVIQGKIDFLLPLGRQILGELGMFKFDVNGGLKEPNHDKTQTVHTVQTRNEDLNQILLQ